MPKNNILNYAKTAKQDEFYTSLSDIEKEMRWYPEAFKDKTVYCNCDDADSNFYKFFKAQFHRLGLKKLICTHFSRVEPSYMIVEEGNGPTREVLDSNGDFRSEECLELLKEADVVVTNPPFSLFREYISQLFDYQKKFLIIGNVNAITYKEVFPHLIANEVWLGCSIHSGDREFRVPDEYEVRTSNSRVDENGTKYVRVAGVRWYTNLDHAQRHEPLTLVKQYHSEKYHKYDNYDAIDISKVVDIPKDYFGAVGVPITFMDKYCPDQFEIVKFRKGDDDKDLAVDGKCPYFRLIIRRKEDSKEYPRYDGQDAIEVKHTADIPKDFNGVMGVPITFLDKFCPDQFEIIGKADAGNADYDLFKPKIDGVAKFKRILIRPKQ